MAHVIRPKMYDLPVLSLAKVDEPSTVDLPGIDGK